MDNKSLFKGKEYEEWCVKENKDPLKPETLVEFNSYKAKLDAEKLSKKKDEERKALESKQKEIFNKMCEYAGVKANYNEGYMFETLDGIIKSVALAAVCTEGARKVQTIVDEVMNK